MKIRLVVGFAVLLSTSATAPAQDSTAGTYNGNYEIQTNRGPQRFGVTMVIDNVENGKVKGTATLQQGSCRGDYPIEGSVKGDIIGVRSTEKGGRAGDCGFGFRGKIDGNRLVGHMGKYEVEFRK